MYIKSLWLDNKGETEQLLQSLNQYLDGFAELPELIYIVSAGEANVLLEQRVMQFITKLEESAHNILFVGSACTSFHAAILSYSRRAEADALIINLEVGKERQQECLDSLGIGVKAGQDGLSVITGVAVTWITRKYHEQSICQISSCDILSQSPSLTGAHELVKSLKRIMSVNFDDASQVVSFDIESKWAKGLLKGFSGTERSTWLPSIEKDGLHYLSIKPLAEIRKYFLEKKLENLWLITLGGGGRAGCIKVVSPAIDRARLLSRLVHTETLSLEDAFSDFSTAQHIGDTLGQDYLPHVREALSYPKRKYRGRHNQIFHWVLNSGSWRSLLENQGAKHG
ncbi:hypothetical protein [Microbulbifer epialgicus]|uniref:Uncharacterized protein n=1 Tax=Microbulbifer epialgicus TaxID=393907 RepID=A0ABV4NX26_9GAMM